MLFTHEEVNQRIQADYEKLLRILPFEIREALKPVINDSEEAGGLTNFMREDVKPASSRLPAT